MGCDIHLHTEVKINGKWEHMGAPNVDRNYALFEKMAGVRGDEENAIAAPRGIPEDITSLTRVDLERMGSDGHSHSWLSGAEIEQLGDWYEAELKKRGSWGYFESTIGFVFGNGWDVKRYPDSYPPGVEDSRAVFWFDN